MKSKGLLLVVCGPSGVGKGTVCNALSKNNEDVFISVSATTRLPREGEVDNISYFFKTRQEFERMIEDNEFLEWAIYLGNYYGTPKRYINEMINNGKDVILEIDVQGALKIKEKFPDGVFIFILPPSMKELEARIVFRGTESREAIEKRLSMAKYEFEKVNEFKYVIMNEDIGRAVKCLEAIICAEKCTRDRNQEIIKECIKNDISTNK